MLIHTRRVDAGINYTVTLQDRWTVLKFFFSSMVTWRPKVDLGQVKNVSDERRRESGLWSPPVIIEIVTTGLIYLKISLDGTVALDAYIVTEPTVLHTIK